MLAGKVKIRGFDTLPRCKSRYQSTWYLREHIKIYGRKQL